MMANYHLLPVSLLAHVRQHLGRDVREALEKDWFMYWVTKRAPLGIDIELRAVTGRFKDGRNRTRSLKSCWEPTLAILTYMSIVACDGRVDRASLVAAVELLDGKRSPDADTVDWSVATVDLGEASNAAA